MTSAAAVVATAVLTALAVLQVLVASGRPYGRLVWGGQHATLPRHLRIGSAASVVVYAGMAWVLLARAGLLPGRSGAVDVLAWVVLAYLALGVVVNGISRSRAERLVQTPTCALLAACALVVALG